MDHLSQFSGYVNNKNIMLHPVVRPFAGPLRPDEPKTSSVFYVKKQKVLLIAPSLSFNRARVSSAVDVVHTIF